MKRSLHRAVLTAAVFGILATAATSARAQGMVAYEFQPRLYLGLGVGYNYLFNDSLYFGDYDEADARVRTHPGNQSGFNWSIYAGVRFNEWVSAELGWDALYHSSAEGGTYNYAVIDGIRGAARIYFPTGYNVMPFIRLGVGYYFYGDEFAVDTQGVGFSGGLGVTYQFHNLLEMDLLVLYRAWYFEGIESPLEGSPIDCESGRYCPFGDDYMHSINIQLDFRWNSWLFAW